MHCFMLLKLVLTANITYSNLTMNKEIISLTTATSLTSKDSLSPCTRNNICIQSSPCYNGAHCTGLWDRFECTCTDMYTGDTCAHGKCLLL